MADEKMLLQMLTRYGISDLKELTEAVRRLEPIDLCFATNGGAHDDSRGEESRRSRCRKKADG